MDSGQMLRQLENKLEEMTNFVSEIEQIGNFQQGGKIHVDLSLLSAIAWASNQPPLTLKPTQSTSSNGPAVDRTITQGLEPERWGADLIMRLERSQEKTRRDRLRAERLHDQAVKVEERARNNFLRSQAPVKKQVGKKLMQRSHPIVKTVKKDLNEVSPEELAKAQELAIFAVNAPSLYVE